MNVIDLAGGNTDAAVSADNDDHSEEGRNESSDNVDTENNNLSYSGVDSNNDDLLRPDRPMTKKRVKMISQP